MTNPVQVQIVRPRKTLPDAIGALIRPVAVLFIDAWLAMLIVPVVTPYAVGFWHMVLILLLVAFVLPARGAMSYLDWTKPAPKKS